MRNQIASMENKHKAEISDLHKQMAENKARGVDSENSLRREVDSLKNIIRDLEARLSEYLPLKLKNQCSFHSNAFSCA